MKKEKEVLSLKWFKERIETKLDKILEARVDQIIGNVLPKEDSPILRMKLVNNCLTVVLKDGRVFTKPDASKTHYELLKHAVTEEDILVIIEDNDVIMEHAQTKKEAKKLTAIADGFKLLSNLKDFKSDGTTLYLKGTSRSIPPLLVTRFAEVVGRINKATPSEYFEDALSSDDEYQGLKNFFMWCCLNPRAEVANELYEFLDRNSFRITRQGFFVALRNVVTVNNTENNVLVSFISNAYNKVKAVWKKNPSDYCVVENDNCLEIKQIYKDKSFIGKNHGNLTQLYLDLPNMVENRFTDAHTRTFDIRVGQLVNMPMEACSWSTQDCGEAGLHFTSDQIHYVGCGDTSVLILINPMKVVGIGYSKGRCYEYLPIMTVPREEATSILHDGDFDTLQLDEKYALEELDNLASRAKEGFTVETSKHTFNLPSISSAEINSIVLSLEDMRKNIIKRISLVD